MEAPSLRLAPFLEGFFDTYSMQDTKGDILVL